MLRWSTSRSKAEEQIGRGQKEEMQRVRLQYLAVMHEPTHLLGARRRRADDMIERLGGGDLVRHRQMPQSRCTMTGASQ